MPARKQSQKTSAYRLALRIPVEMAGGIGTDGQNAILDIEPCELHQRVPIFIGSKKMVEKALDFLK